MPSRDYFLGPRNAPIMLAYQQYIVDVAVLLGANPTLAMIEAATIVNFEIELAKVERFSH